MQSNDLSRRHSTINLTVLLAVLKFKALGFRAKARRAKTKYRKQIESDDRRWAGRRLKLSGRAAVPIPQEIFGLFELEILDLSTERTSGLDFRIERLPRAIGYLYRLRVLNLDVNGLTSLPNEIGELKNLECLTVSCNRLQTLPLSYKKLTRLESLHLASNCFQAFPLVICQMESLRFLDLSCNRIGVLPPTLSKLKRLRTLMLYNNKISEWPDPLCDLLELHTLWLGKNELKRLPLHFGQLRHLDWANYPLSSNIDDNPLMSPPLNVCQLGIQAIRDYLES
ncbi:unnamed protein product [Rotaria magnacalcarata]|uniref:Disease resistance R13L4/SHOC-2-like LRR domain-containing protein n=1 Tax=Rotaria magnacalcarata TaxID=392030 RepID=A0A819E024_9BILA|nr:unnamed protein product [Rotaria magnacalcarata]CAF1223024.1 unnamed protein product [Rotaria magnacalcarata]CAF1922299.1 unnamed protein product [Rotaria magnacalcarata]CAF1935167.1 unnamed protein product [Rotaria magnacalcarata]CAF1969948.1 unnamed protein product [Rotaria magnacalcarata]